MRFLFFRPIWFALARLPFRKTGRQRPALPAAPVWGQNALAHVPAGRRTMDYMGCEMLALYNALRFFGRNVPLEHIIKTYECRHWLLLGGHWGADPYAAGRYLAESGLPCRRFCGKQGLAELESCVKEGQAVILSFWLGDTAFSGAHAVAATRRKTDWVCCNLYNRQTAPLSVGSLRELCPPHRFIVGFALPAQND